jgi:FAD/FMN-containing dehydrogenase
MSPTSDGGPLRRRTTKSPTGTAATIVETLERLIERPDDDALAAAVVRLMFEDAALFVGTVLENFVIPSSTPQSADNPDSDFPCGRAKRWENYVGSQMGEPFEIACPRTLADLRETLSKAALLRCPVRAVGSHHAWSDAALTDGIAIETHGLLEPLVTADATLLRNPADADTLVHASGGMTIQALNAALDKRGQALLNMGGFDGQTLAGVISTSTHGSGLTLGAFPSFVEALVVIDADGKAMQIEKSAGISDPQKFADHVPDVYLIQDDKTFNASVAAFGSVGIIYAVILRVRSRYFLSETRTIHTWAELREMLRRGDPLRKNRHVEVLINPHKISSENTCLLTLRNEVPEPAEPSPPKPFRNLFAQFIASLPGAGDVLAALFRSFPRLSPRLVDSGIRALQDDKDFVALSYTMLNVGAANGFPVICSELAVDLERHVDATDMILRIAAQAASEGTFQSGPIALRYVARSPGFLTMHPRETATIELPMFFRVFGSESLTWRFEQALTATFDARPHWGQLNFMTGSHQMVERLFGASSVASWLDVFQRFNPGGEFFSRMTDRVGFSTHAPMDVVR